MAVRPLIDRSRVIAALKLGLPLLALGLMSSVVLLATPVDPSRALATAEIDVAERARDPRLSGARYAGVTDSGAAIRVEAGLARSDAGNALRFEGEALVMRIEGATSGDLTARSDLGAIDRSAGRFEMQGDVRIDQAPDTWLEASMIEGALDSTWLEAEGPVTGWLQGADIAAGHLSVTDDPDNPGSLRLVFSQGVRLIYLTTD
jgi:lipopolysaccharide export system protein LptC